MANARILSVSETDSVTLSATSEALDVDNVKDSDVRKPWRSTGLTSQTITWDFGAGVASNGIYLGNLNLTDAGTVKLELSNDNFSSTVLDETFGAWADDQAHRDAVLFYDSVTTRYGRLSFTDASNPDGFFEAGRIMFGNWFAAPNSSNIAVGPKLDYSERAATLRTRGGSFRSDNKAPARVVRCLWRNVHRDDAFTLGGNAFAELLRVTGSRGDVVISAYPEQAGDLERAFTVYGRITDRSGLDGHFEAVAGSVVTPYFGLELEITESI